MSIFIKSGVKIGGLQPEAIVGLMVAYSVFDSLGLAFRFTSGLDGKHKDTSLHYRGKAIDCGLHHVAEALWRSIADSIAANCGPEFDVLLETDPVKGPHIHVEWDPKPKMVV